MDRNALYQRWAGVVAVLLCIAVFIAMKPIAVPLVLAAWTATLAQPIHRKLGGGGVAAGAMTAVLIVALIAILGLLYAFLAQGAAGLASSLERADSPQAAFEALVTPGEAPADLGALKKMNQEHPEFGKYAALLGIGTVLFLFFLALGTVGLLTGGEKLYAWLQKHAPLRADHFDRLGDAFTETGRGLFTSIGLTCLIQGILCTITFAALSVPRPLVLGFICALFAILPVVGTPLVWIPVAIGLFITGATVKGVILLAVGGGVIAVIEVVIGPMLAKLGRFKLDGGLILLSMFGGALGLGPGGLVLGPLVFRLAKEAAQLWRESAA